MYINIELDDFIDLIKNLHTAQETAELLAKYLNTDLDSDIHISDNNYYILSQALLKNNSISDIIDNFYNNNPGLVIQCIFEYNNTENINSDDLCKALCLLQNVGYITNTGLFDINSYDAIDNFEDLINHHSFKWSEQDFRCESEHLDILRQLVLTYIKTFTLDNIQYCDSDEEWTNDPYKYIKDKYFGGYNGAKEKDVLDVLFSNFNKLKADYISYFSEIMPINNSTTLDEFKELCLNSDYNDFSNAYHNLVNNTNFFDVTGIIENYFD